MMRMLISLLFCILTQSADAQKAIGMPIITKYQKLNDQIASNAAMGMIDLSLHVPNIRFELKYAGNQNFTGKRMYPADTKTTFLRVEPAKALAALSKELEELGLGLLIWDAYRPYSVTVRFWKLIHDERYVANPSKGSGHNRGIAVDLSLYHLSSGKALSMPTDFDDFSEKAHHGYAQLNQEQIKNRELLLSLMAKYGFKKFETEWWHYYWPDSEKYEILDIPFNKLKMLK
jgi:D-alanyl-D-alanine dipeptidase